MTAKGCHGDCYILHELLLKFYALFLLWKIIHYHHIMQNYVYWKISLKDTFVCIKQSRLLHIIIQFSNATNFMLHRKSCCTGCHVAPDVMLHRMSCCTGCHVAPDVMLHRMSCCTGCHVALEVMLHQKSCCTGSHVAHQVCAER